MLAPIKIGHVLLPTNLALAPMAGYADLAFRLVVRSIGGVGLTCTPLLSCEGILRQTRHSMELATNSPDDRPLAMQFFGGDAARLSEAARWAEDHGADIIDLNMGCTVRKVLQQNGGAALLRDPDTALRIVERMKSSLRRAPLTVKIRLGWDDAHLVAPGLASRLEQAGVAAIAVHARTAEQKFSGTARLDGIADVVAAVRTIPIIGNGDVRTPENARRMIEQTGCRGVMIGRAALAAPWIFRDTWAYLNSSAGTRTSGASKAPVPAPVPVPAVSTPSTPSIPSIASVQFIAPTLEEKCGWIRRHFQNLVRLRGERIAVLEIRKHIHFYARHLGPCRTLKQSLAQVKSAADFERSITEFTESRRGV